MNAQRWQQGDADVTEPRPLLAVHTQAAADHVFGELEGAKRHEHAGNQPGGSRHFVAPDNICSGTKFKNKGSEHDRRGKTVHPPTIFFKIHVRSIHEFIALMNGALPLLVNT